LPKANSKGGYTSLWLVDLGFRPTPSCHLLATAYRTNKADLPYIRFLEGETAAKAQKKSHGTEKAATGRGSCHITQFLST
jgi:hypothetical protein